jgi:hypothetical protein
MTEHPIPRATSPGIGSNARGRGAPATGGGHSSRVGERLRALAVATAALLAVDAYVHLTDAGFYDALTSSIFVRERCSEVRPSSPSSSPLRCSSGHAPWSGRSRLL